MQDIHILLWSGGFDSTAILLSLLGNKELFPSVALVSCGLTNANNYAEDKKARETIIDLLELKTNPRFFLIEKDMEASWRGGTQATAWAWVAAMNVAYDKEATLYFGYIKGDEFWHYKHEFETSVRSLASIHSSAKVNFSYPLEWLVKKEILSWYIHHPKVFDSISWGGDTATIKAKEKEELEFIYKEMVKAKGLGEPEHDKEKSKENITNITSNS